MSSSRRFRRVGSRALALLVLGALALGGAGCAKPQKPSEAQPAVPASARRSGMSEREKVSVTVYNSSFGLVREQRTVDLGTGRVALAYEDVSAFIQPETVHIRSLDADDGIAVLEQNYRYDVLTPEKLLEKYVGRRLKVVRQDERGGEDQIEDAELLSVANGPVLRIDGQIVTGGFSRFIFPELPASLLSKPTLVWLLDSTRQRQKLEVSYLSQNLTWRADYVLVLDESDARGDLSGWVTLDNQSGTSFMAAELKLVAGDVQRVTPPPPPMPMPEMDAMEESVAHGSVFTREALFEYHLYGLERPTDLLDKEQKQVSLLEAHGITVKKKLVFRGADYHFRGRVDGTPEKQKVSVLVSIDNSESKGLGVPLPKGILRVYKADKSGAQQFVGEDTIDHTPRDEEIEVKLGEAFDVVAERRQASFRVLGKCQSESDWELELKNHKDSAASVEVIEPAGGDYEIVRSSHPPLEGDAQSFTFEVDVPARGAVKLTYRVRVRWC